MRIGPRIGLRIGHGFDVHRFGEGDYIVLGGGENPSHPRIGGAF